MNKSGTLPWRYVPVQDRDNQIFSTQFFDKNGNSIGLTDTIEYVDSNGDTHTGVVVGFDIRVKYDFELDSVCYTRSFIILVRNEKPGESKVEQTFYFEDSKNMLNLSAENEYKQRTAVVSAQCLLNGNIPESIEDISISESNTNDDVFMMGIV